jgi:serine/threonine protein kinase
MNMMRSISNRKILEDSGMNFKHLAPPTRELLLPGFHIDEVRLGKQTHAGKYTCTFEISSIIQNHIAENARHQWARDLIDKDGRRKSSRVSNEKRLCIKYIRREFMDSHDDFESAATNLANDAQMMSALNHKNIAKLRGSSLDGTEAYYKTGRHDGYFLLVDRISETLDERLSRWRSRSNWLHLKRRVGCRGTKTETEFLVERLRCAYKLADAIDYMHEHGIAHMNVNEYSVGFNSQGELQLYELGDSVPISSRSYCKFSEERIIRQGSSGRTSGNMTGIGFDDEDDDTPPKHDDVFAFTSLLCEILVLRPKVKKGLPPSISHHLHEGNSTIRAFRELASVIPSELLHLLQRGLSRQTETMPSMSEYTSVLAVVLSSLDKENANAPKTERSLHKRRTHIKLPMPLCVLNKSTQCYDSTEEETFSSTFGDSLRV